MLFAILLVAGFQTAPALDCRDGCRMGDGTTIVEFDTADPILDGDAAPPFRWRLIAATNDGPIYLDMQTRKNVRAGRFSTGSIENGREVWLKQIETKDVRVVHSIQRWEADCANSTIDVLEMAKYDQQGNVVSSFKFPRESPARVIPESHGEIVFRNICATEPEFSFGITPGVRDIFIKERMIALQKADISPMTAAALISVFDRNPAALEESLAVIPAHQRAAARKVLNPPM